jgi:hypothetical protein
MMALEARRVQFVNAIAERDEAHAQRMRMMQERDEAIRLVEAREAARIKTVFQATRQATNFDRRELDLIRQIEELQIDVHHLNNMVNPILLPAPVEEDDPNVLVIEDNGMEVDAEAEPEDEEEEIEPFEDDHGDGVFDVDSDHSEAYFSCST